MQRLEELYNLNLQKKEIEEKIKNKEPQLYEELLDVYPKITKRSAYLRVKIK